MIPYISLTIDPNSGGYVDEPTDRPVVDDDDEDGYLCIGPPQVMLTYVQELASAVALKVHA